MPKTPEVVAVGVVCRQEEVDRLPDTLLGAAPRHQPRGFSGRACFTGGCGRAFRHDGCGGMVDGELIF